MFFALLIACVVGATVHAARHSDRSWAKRGELLLVYTLVGYCGVPMVLVALGILIAPDRMFEMLLPMAPTSPVVAFFGWAYLGMALIATMAAWVRDSFLMGPALCWAMYFAGATLVHLHEPGAGGHGGALIIFATHGLVAVVLATGLVMRRQGAALSSEGR